MASFSFFIRWSIFLCDVLIWLGGSAMLGLGIWVSTQETEYKHLTGNLYVTIGYIIMSSFIFIVGFIGACGILLLNGKLLKLYFALLLILFLAELGAAVYFYLEKDKIEGHIQDNWNKTDDQTRILIQEKDCYSEIKSWLQKNYLLLATSAAAVAAIEMFVLGGTCRLIADLETGNRQVSRTKVVPMNSVPKRKTGTATAQAEEPDGGRVANAADQEDAAEIPPEKRTQRKSWAKKDPKYEAVFSKM